MRFKLNLEGRVRNSPHVQVEEQRILGKEESMFQDTQVYFGPGDHLCTLQCTWKRKGAFRGVRGDEARRSSHSSISYCQSAYYVPDSGSKYAFIMK